MLSKTSELSSDMCAHIKPKVLLWLRDESGNAMKLVCFKVEVPYESDKTLLTLFFLLNMFYIIWAVLRDFLNQMCRRLFLHLNLKCRVKKN